MKPFWCDAKRIYSSIMLIIRAFLYLVKYFS
nr:MAG TPA: hypothetical protein [Caudoviricetes sp.]DAU25499.1 MAG TPA: hypothetical protein [Caudoviricetes sp.]